MHPISTDILTTVKYIRTDILYVQFTHSIHYIRVLFFMKIQLLKVY